MKSNIIIIHNICIYRITGMHILVDINISATHYYGNLDYVYQLCTNYMYHTLGQCVPIYGKYFIMYIQHMVLPSMWYEPINTWSLPSIGIHYIYSQYQVTYSPI